MSRILGAVSRARHDAKEIKDRAKEFAEQQMLDAKLVDLSIQFIGASNLPKMDIVGLADPYFVANLDDKIAFVSNVLQNTLSPVWNESWNVKNVPETAVLSVEVLDKDEGSVHDDFIGGFTTSVTPGAKEVEIVSTIRKIVRGTFWLKVSSSPSEPNPRRRYVFDGPIRYTRHFSPTIGRLTNLNDERLYSTWKIHIKGIPLFFRDEVQHWNTKYRAAQTIFGIGPASLAVRSSIRSGHRLLYARSTSNAAGLLETRDDFLSLLRGSKNPTSTCRIKPAVYTYIISAKDDTFRFSETGAAFFVDFASKHALHANCAEEVRYSGEFHPRPAVPGGWKGFSDDMLDESVEWELVIDNNSGTYSPDAMLLPDLKDLLEYNFRGLKVVALDHQDPRLEETREACRAYAMQYRGVRQQDLQPHANEGEETLQHHAFVNTPKVERPDEQPPLSEMPDEPALSEKLENEFDKFMHKP
ncbi:C2-domain-containing protein [Fomitiporia mediterranea MF3/22]|uniref:C2-domain-containing protein n=1 Tax=Fomitiporia mediterranea (strain MF3/22) TaxID=694068 RepID=UPI000440754B|nr:C2-domain-containing protein [Fomitiporia mediterranea MF3/22]EJD06147.1 C2-domain-containing protein [Fomitiporia mediterranea MF3/22]